MKKTIIKISLFCVVASLIIQQIHATETGIQQSTSSYFTASNALFFGILITGGYITFNSYYNLVKETEFLKKRINAIETNAQNFINNQEITNKKLCTLEKKIDEGIREINTNQQIDKRSTDYGFQKLKTEIEKNHKESQENFLEINKKIDTSLDLLKDISQKIDNSTTKLESFASKTDYSLSTILQKANRFQEKKDTNDQNSSAQRGNNAFQSFLLDFTRKS